MLLMQSFYFLLSGFILGTILGSLAKALADRSLTRRTFFGGSKCEFCKKHLSPLDLFPILSYLFLKGRCRYCKKNISIEYLLVEVFSGALIAFLFWQSSAFFPGFEDIPKLILFLSPLLFNTFAVTILLILTLTDLKKTLIPDRISYPAIIIALVFLVVFTLYKIWLVFASLNGSAIGKYLLPPYSDYFFRHAFIVAEPLIYGIITGFAIALFFLALIFVTKGRGMGGGDVKLGAFIGLVSGFPNGLLSLMLSFMTGAVVGIFLMAFGKKKLGQTIPFGPFLALGTLMTIFWGDTILNFYMNLKLS